MTTIVKNLLSRRNRQGGRKWAHPLFLFEFAFQTVKYG